MAQTSNFFLCCRQEIKIDPPLIEGLVNWLGSSVNRATIWNRRNQIVEMLGSVSPSEICSWIGRNQWAMIKLYSPPPRFQAFLREHLGGLPSPQLPGFSSCECSVRAGKHTILGQSADGEEADALKSWLTVSFSCEGVPSHWKDFEAELIKSDAAAALLNEFKMLVPSGEKAIRFFI